MKLLRVLRDNKLVVIAVLLVAIYVTLSIVMQESNIISGIINDVLDRLMEDLFYDIK